MIEVDPEAALELRDARDYYENARSGLGALFELAAQRSLDVIEDSPALPAPSLRGNTRGPARLFRPAADVSYLVRSDKAPYSCPAPELGQNVILEPALIDLPVEVPDVNARHRWPPVARFFYEPRHCG